MDSTELSLNQFFFPTGELPAEQRSKIESSETMSILKEKLLKEAKVKWPVALDLVLKKLSDILDVKILDIMQTAWKKYSVLLKYTDKQKYPPNESFLVSLADHTVKSEHKPSIEILVNGQRVGEVNFNVVISLTLNGIILKIQDGRIKEVNTGTCKGKGTLKCENIVILEKETESISLPGTIKLGEGIPITP